MRGIAVRLWQPAQPRGYWNSHDIYDHTVLPATRHRGDIPAVTPVTDGIRFSDHGGMHG